MSSAVFYNALVKRPNERSEEDLAVIFAHLRRLDVFERLHDAPLRSVCRTARLERHPANYVLFRKGQLATCWYILLSGSVFMNKQIYLPIGCFGKRSAGMNLRRLSDCIVLSLTDCIVIDYPDVQLVPVHVNSSSGVVGDPPSCSSSSFGPPIAPSPLFTTFTSTSSSSAAVHPNPPPASSHPASSFPASSHPHHHPSSHHHLPSSHPIRRTSPVMPSCCSSSASAAILMRRCSSGSGGGGMASSANTSADHHHPLPHHSDQQQQHPSQPIFHRHRFPAPSPPASATVASSSPSSSHYHPHSQHLLSSCDQQHSPSTSSTLIRQQPQQHRHNNNHQHRVPSPAPTSSSDSTFSKQMIRPIPVSNHCHPHNNQQQHSYHHPPHLHYHSKSNSMSEERAEGMLQKHNNHNSIHQPLIRQTPLVEEDLIDNKSAPYLQAIAGSNSVHKKPVFNPKSQTLNPAMRRSPNPEANSVTKPKKDRSPNPPAGQKDCSPNSSMGEEKKSKNMNFASNFQRLSRVRLNMARKMHHPTSSSSSDPSSSSSVAAQPAIINVRIGERRPLSRDRAKMGQDQQQQQADNDCFAGLPETAVDSEGLAEGEDDEEEDDEDEDGSCPSHDSELRDNVRECLERPPDQRTADDLAVLIEFMDSLSTLSSLPMAIKRHLSLKMVFAHVPQRGTCIMQNGERIDAWSVVVNGCVEHVRSSDDHRTEYRVGECFGVKPIAQAQFNDGEIRTLTNDCEFILVEHAEFHAIMSTLSRQIEQEQDKTGILVREVERRVIDEQVELIITKASPEKLLQQLLVDTENGNGSRDSSVGGGELHDSHFVDDFLLMHRVFFRDTAQIVRQLLDWFRDEPPNRDRVTRTMLIWLNNHFGDFESANSDSEMNKSKRMCALLDQFDEMLADAKMFNHQSLLSITVSVKSLPRMITLTRSDRADQLDFQLIGGHNGIFVLSVNPDSAAEKAGIKRWDEIMEVNGQNCRRMHTNKVLEVLKESTHLSLMLKTNWIGFKEALLHGDETYSCHSAAGGSDVPLRATNSSAMPARYQKKSSAPMIGGMIATNSHAMQQPRERRSTLCSALQKQAEYEQRTASHIAGTATPSSTGSNSGSATLSSRKVLNKLMHMIRGGGGQQQLAMMNNNHTTADPYQQLIDSADELSPMPLPSTPGGGSLRASRSNPDISAHSLLHHQCSSSSGHRHSSLCTNKGGGSDVGRIGGIGGGAEQMLKVYRADQSFRYVSVLPEHTAKQLVHMSLHEFDLQPGDGECWWALYECSVSREGVSKQRRLPDEANNLAERVGLNARLYLRNMQRAEESNLLPDELIPELLKQTRLTLYTLNAQCIAAQLTLQDFAVFAAIEPTEYVNNLFQLTDNEDPCSSARLKGWQRLEQFETLFNREMWWVATEVCCERNVYRRSKLVKKFIKIARHCHLLRNLNSMFAIVSGLEKPAVRRLLHTWERVPGKYHKMLADLQLLMDPSRNMYRYRQNLAQLAQDPPVIPIYPILRKDLIFAHEANATFCGPNLVNFEKLRMIAQIVRNIQRYSSVPYDQAELFGANAVTSDQLMDPGTIRKGIAGMGSQGSRFGTSGGGGISRKKMYERTLMGRRVKDYLARMPVIDSEADLDRISLSCEPPLSSNSGGVSSSSTQQLYHHHHHNNNHNLASNTPGHGRRRLPSPSPSSLSSQSNQSNTLHEQIRRAGLISLPKFGVESPQAVQKMLSLVQNSKIRSRASARTIQSRDDLPPTGFDLQQSNRSSVTSSGGNSNNEGIIA